MPKHTGVDIFHKWCIKYCISWMTYCVTTCKLRITEYIIFHNILFTCCIKNLLFSFRTFHYSLTYWDMYLPLQFYEILP